MDAGGRGEVLCQPGGGQRRRHRRTGLDRHSGHGRVPAESPLWRQYGLCRDWASDPGNQVQVLGEENGWYEVLITKKRVYVCGKYLNVAEVPPAANKAPSQLDEQSLTLFLSLMMQGMTGGAGSTGALTPEGNLTLVDEADLLSLMEDGEPALAVCSCSAKCAAGAVNTSCAVCSVNMSECAGKAPEPDPDPEPQKKGGNTDLLVIILVLALAGDGAVYYLKFMQKKPEAKGGTGLDDYDYGDEDELEEDGS